MSFDDRPKDNPLNWSWRIGSLFGIAIRLHLFFFLGLLWVVVEGFRIEPSLRGVLYSLGLAGILFAIVLLHEFGHCWGARKTGGEADEILLWPLGGLAMVRPPHNPGAYFFTTAAGPMVNVIICAATTLALVIRHGTAGAIPWNPLAPFAPLDNTVDPHDLLQFWLRAVFGISYIVLLFNLLPIYPMDGGRMLHSYLWPRKGYRDAMLLATQVGMIGAVVLGTAGLITGAMLMLGIALFGGFTCYRDRQIAKWQMDEETGAFGYDFSKGYGAFEDGETKVRKPGYLARRRIAKEEAQRKREAEEYARHRQRVDEILEKVHKHGMSSLTPEEVRVLQKETERQRSEEG